MMMAISGSPRKDGNTEQLLGAFLEGVKGKWEIKMYRLAEQQLHGCKGCGACYAEGNCIFHDDIWTLYEELERCQALVVSSPIYFASITAQLKSFIDRAQPFWARKYALKQTHITALKGGFFLSVGAMETDRYFQNARLVVKSFFHVLDAPYGGDLFISGLEDREDVKGRVGALDLARQAGEDFLLPD